MVGGGTVAVGDAVTAALGNNKMLLIDTGANINAVTTTYAGMIAICTSTGSGFTADTMYRRNSANTAWKVLGAITGEIKAWGGLQASPPAGYLLCDGSAVSRTTYADLFTILSTRFGAGDGSTTFNLPDLRGKYPRGAPALTEAGGTLGEDTHVLTTAEMPVHNHTLTDPGHAHTMTGFSNSGTGFTKGPGGVSGATDSNTSSNGTGISMANAGGGAAHENRPASQHVHWIIAI